MPAAFSWFLAARYLVTRWVNVLGVLGVMFAVWAMISVIGVFSGFIGEIRDNARVASPELLLTNLDPDREHSYDELQEVIEADRDVEATAPRLKHYAIYYPADRTRSVQYTQVRGFDSQVFDFVTLLGIDAASEPNVTDFRQWLKLPKDPDDPFDRNARFRVEDPRDPFAITPERMRLSAGSGSLVATPAGIMLTLDRMAQRSPYGILPGTLVDVVSAREDGDDLRFIQRRVVGSGAFETRHGLFDNSTALLDIEEVRTILGHDIDSPSSVDLVTSVAIQPRPGADVAALVARLLVSCRTLGGPDIAVQTWEEQNAVYLGAVDMERGLMKLVLFAVMLVAAFLVYATLHMMVIQKTKDIGILTSMGATRGAISAIFLISSLSVASVGSALGTALGFGSLAALNPVNNWVFEKWGVELFPRNLYKMDGIPYRLDPDWIVTVVAAAVVLSLLVAWFPARRAANMEPVQALAYE